MKLPTDYRNKTGKSNISKMILNWQKNELAYLISLISKAEITSCPSVQQKIETEGLFSGGQEALGYTLCSPCFFLYLTFSLSFGFLFPTGSQSCRRFFITRAASREKPEGMSWRRSSTSHLLPSGPM